MLNDCQLSVHSEEEDLPNDCLADRSVVILDEEDFAFAQNELELLFKQSSSVTPTGE